VKSVLTILLFFSGTQLPAQVTSYHLSFNSGFFYYKNINAGYMSQVNVGSAGTAYTNHPTSDNPGFSYGLSAAVQRTTGYHMILGLDAGIESVQTKQQIIRTYGPFPYDFRPATGKTAYTRSFLNLFGYLGYSQGVAKNTVNIKAGFEYAAGLGAGMDKGNVNITAIDSSFKVHHPVPKSQNFDIRLRFQAELWYKSFGIYTGYSTGAVNYYSRFIGASPEAYARYLRIGVQYRIKS
jgi:hypothetical protein